jgi:hypothetical protein
MVKSMTLIGRSYTYDAFLANTQAGKLMTVRWPTNYLSVPTATPVRDATWQGFEAVGHANGQNTVIKGLGKVPMAFSDPQYFRWAPKYDTLNGG